MTTAALRVPRQPPVPTTAYRTFIGMPGGAWPCGATRNAVYYNGHTYIGYIDGNGNIRVASYDHAAKTVTVSPAIATGFAVDQHTAPGVLVRSSDHKILVAYTHQGDPHMYVALSTNAEDVTAWGAPTDIASTLGGTAYSFATFVQLSGESGKIYLFFRDQQDSGATSVLCYSTSTDGGMTWTAQSALYKNGGHSSFWSIDTDSTTRIDFAVSDGTIANGDTASVYHFYYSAGSYYKSDGTLITAAHPLGPASLTKLYDGATNGSVRIPYMIDASGPHVVLAAANAGGWATNPENYWYAVYSGGWSIHEITDAGAIPTNDLNEGGVTLDAIDPTRVYLCRSSGGNYQLYLYETSDGGATWTSTLLTSESGDNQNYHPISPSNADSRLRCLWNSGTIAPDLTQNFTCQIRSYPREA